MNNDSLMEQMNKEYYKSISMSWAYLAIKNFYDSVASDDDEYEFAYNMLLTHGHVVYHEFKKDFESIWLCFFKSLDSIPSGITEKYFCKNCSEDIDYPF